MRSCARLSKADRGGEPLSSEQLHNALHHTLHLYGSDESAIYTLYDADGNRIFNTDEPNTKVVADSVYPEKYTEAQFLGFGYVEKLETYADYLITPVWSEDHDQIVGYLKSVQKNAGILDYLATLNMSEGAVGEGNTYALIHVGEIETDEQDYIIQWERGSENPSAMVQ